MPQREVDNRYDLVAAWARKAEEDVQAAELLVANSAGLANPIAFHSQQAVEKYMKAYLTFHQIPFPKTHDIERLLVFIESVDRELAHVLADTTVLSLYGVEVRYPTDRQEATEQEAYDAVALMRKTRDILRRRLPNFSE